PSTTNIYTHSLHDALPILNDITPFLEKKQYTFEVYRPASNYPAIFDVTSIPRTFLIDKEGNIIIDETGATNWNSETVRNTIDGLDRKSTRLNSSHVKNSYA